MVVINITETFFKTFNIEEQKITSTMYLKLICVLNTYAFETSYEFSRDFESLKECILNDCIAAKDYNASIISAIREVFKDA
jgi:hypothetical protein